MDCSILKDVACHDCGARLSDSTDAPPHFGCLVALKARVAELENGIRDLVSKRDRFFDHELAALLKPSASVSTGYNQENEDGDASRRMGGDEVGMVDRTWKVHAPVPRGDEFASGRSTRVAMPAVRQEVAGVAGPWTPKPRCRHMHEDERCWLDADHLGDCQFKPYPRPSEAFPVGARASVDGTPVVVVRIQTDPGIDSDIKPPHGRHVRFDNGDEALYHVDDLSPRPDDLLPITCPSCKSGFAKRVFGGHCSLTCQEHEAQRTNDAPTPAEIGAAIADVAGIVVVAGRGRTFWCRACGGEWDSGTSAEHRDGCTFLKVVRASIPRTETARRIVDELAPWDRDPAEKADYDRRVAWVAEQCREPHPIARPKDEWHEDHGPALWWSFPVEEPPYAGTPLDDDFPEYMTHWTPLPPVPEEPSPTGSGDT